MTGAVPGIIDDDWREPFHPRTARVLEMGGGHGSGGDANAIPVAVVVADDDPPGDRADDVPVAAVASPAPSPKKAPPPNSGASPCPEVAELAHLRRLVAKGVPLTVAQAGRARRLIAALVHGPHCSRLADASLNLAAPAKPVWPPPGGVGPTVPIRSRLRLAQELITALQYNHTDAVTYFTVDKARPTCRVMDTARDIIRHGLPIRCVEAVFLAMYLTAGWKEVERIPLRMRSVVVDDEGVERSHAHIVLLIRERALDETGAVRDNLIDEASKGRVDETDRSNGDETPSKGRSIRYGALGTSRRDELAYVPFGAPTLTTVLEHYRAGYAKWRHRLVGVKIGLPVEHDTRASSPVCWRHVAVECGGDGWDAAMRTLEAHDARCCGGGVGTRRHYDKWRCDGQMWTNDADKLLVRRRERDGGWSGRSGGGDAGGRRAAGGRFPVASSPVKSPGGQKRTSRSARAAA
ncbi:predicted protein [Micromonas commoda]|uniref:Uncharacterized protein n=1 Tax=Micromonas commoda (strain RCC299 / NOUM17 / CCMP2709) TaxID=296587 RepID=C1E7N7_MICCC|nr:predicted protein [Micromonas commoda]ACO64016.1 predicted protein [Micromonas commoda]|eukprot:XP_002502758.1 predicted protein [Micromonas commoda]